MTRVVILLGLIMSCMPAASQTISEGTKVPYHSELRITSLAAVGNLKPGDMCIPSRFGIITILAHSDDRAGIRYEVLGHSGWQECPTGMIGTIPLAVALKSIRESARKSEDDFMTDFRRRQERQAK